jgi:hypothetical protein
MPYEYTDFKWLGTMEKSQEMRYTIKRENT